MPTPSEIKKALVSAGLEVYLQRGDAVHVAERVRENLIMDSGIRVTAAGPSVSFIVRAQRTDFPGDPDERLFERARDLATRALDRGYREIAVQVTPVRDPGDEARTIDTWCEVTFERAVDDVAAAMDEVRFALLLEKAARPG